MCMFIMRYTYTQYGANRNDDQRLDLFTFSHCACISEYIMFTKPFTYSCLIVVVPCDIHRTQCQNQT